MHFALVKHFSDYSHKVAIINNCYSDECSHAKNIFDVRSKCSLFYQLQCITRGLQNQLKY